MKVYRDYFTAEAFAIWAHGSLALSRLGAAWLPACFIGFRVDQEGEARVDQEGEARFLRYLPRGVVRFL